MSIETNWYVITGTLSSGKTSVIKHLSSLGYDVVFETARLLIDNEIKKGKTIEEIRSDELSFQEKVLEMKIDIEEKIPLNQLTFFDRGIPDSIAYYQMLNHEVSSIIKSSQRRYKGVFLLEMLPVKKDYARVENKKTALYLQNLLCRAYQDLDYQVIKVPVKPVKERVQFILNRIP